jgi:alkylation response protein AidB-like acyl-CoA dehydrogenase
VSGLYAGWGVEMIRSEALLEATADLVQARIAPLARALDEGEWLESVWVDLCNLGVPAMPIPENVGGLGLSYSSYLDVTAVIAASSAVAALMPALNVLVARALIRHGSAATRDRYLPDLVTGKSKACWCFTEPGTGSDPKSIRTTASTSSDGGWMLQGEKSFISHSSHATVAVVFAQLDGSLTAFIGETDAGFVPAGRERLIAFGGADTGAVSLQSMRVWDTIGEPGDGFKVLLAAEAEAKLRASAICQGMAEHALREAVQYARKRLHRDRPIGEKFQSIQWLLAECSSRVEAIQALVERGGREIDAGKDVATSAARIKLMSSRLCRETVSDAVQVHGAYGISKAFDVEMLYRQAKVYELVQGVSELNRVIIARDLLGSSRG